MERRAVDAKAMPKAFPESAFTAIMVLAIIQTGPIVQ
jgi:hypothetical protein